MLAYGRVTIYLAYEVIPAIHVLTYCAVWWVQQLYHSALRYSLELLVGVSPRLS